AGHRVRALLVPARLHRGGRLVQEGRRHAECPLVAEVARRHDAGAGRGSSLVQADVAGDWPVGRERLAAERRRAAPLAAARARGVVCVVAATRRANGARAAAGVMTGTIPAWAAVAFVTLLGAVIGSFLNVCIYRLPRGKSIVWPSSACPHCDRTLAWYENVPI